MADGIVEEEIVKITVDDKELDKLPQKMGKVTGEMNSYLTLTGQVADKTGDLWTRVAADMVKVMGNVGDATSRMAVGLKKHIPEGVKATNAAISIMDKMLTQTMTSMIKHHVPMEEMQQWFEKIGVSGEDFNRILAKAQTQLGEVSKVAMPAAAAMAEFGEKAKFSAEMLFTATGKGLISIISQMKEGGMSAKEVVTAFDDAGRSTRGLGVAMVKAGYEVGETTTELEKMTPAAKRTDWSLRGIIKSIEWAAYRFLFALGIYMLFRKVIRGVNEAVADAIKLFEEFNIQQRQFNAVLSLSAQTVSGFRGDTAEWAKIIEELGDKYGYTTAKIYEVARSIGRTNMALKLNDKQLADVIDMVVNYGKQLGYTGEELPKFAEAFADAVEGSAKTWEQMAIMPMTDEIIEAWWRMAAGVKEGTDAATQYVLTNLSEQEQAQLRYLYILAQVTNKQVEMAYAVPTAAAEANELLRTEYEEQAAIAGESAQVFTQLGLEMKIFFAGLVTTASRLVILAVAELKTLVDFVKSLLDELQIPRAEWEDPSVLYGRAHDKALVWVESFVTKVEGAGRGAKKAAESLGDFGKQAAGIVPGVEDATDAVKDLGESVIDAMMESDRARTQASADYWKDYNETLEDQKKDELKLEERYADKADDLRKRAADKIADLRKRAAEDEEKDRADLLLRLHQMEEDYQLSLKQLYENYQMDYEEAARTRDAVTMRRLTRQYKLEKKQRGEDYNLQVHQTVESWEARHKENQTNLDAEIKEVQDSLAVELAELEAEKAEELQGIKDNWAERRQELLDQYNQELIDLKAALERRLTDAIVEWADQNNIPLNAVRAVVAAMAEQYDLDVENLSKATMLELGMLEARREAWEELAKAAMGVPSEDVLKRFGPGWGKIPQLEFAQGGMAIATAPTLVKVGEAGPELFTAIPLAKGGSVLGGMRGYGGGDFHLSIDGNQTGLWSSDFERGVEHTVAKIFKEAFQE